MHVFNLYLLIFIVVKYTHSIRVIFLGVLFANDTKSHGSLNLGRGQGDERRRAPPPPPPDPPDPPGPPGTCCRPSLRRRSPSCWTGRSSRPRGSAAVQGADRSSGEGPRRPGWARGSPRPRVPPPCTVGRCQGGAPRCSSGVFLTCPSSRGRRPPSPGSAPPGGARSRRSAARPRRTSRAAKKGKGASPRARVRRPPRPAPAHALRAPRSLPPPQTRVRAEGGAARGGGAGAGSAGARPGRVGFGAEEAAPRPRARRRQSRVRSPAGLGLGPGSEARRPRTPRRPAAAASQQVRRLRGGLAPGSPPPPRDPRAPPLGSGPPSATRFDAVRVQHDAGKRAGGLGPGRQARKCVRGGGWGGPVRALRRVPSRSRGLSPRGGAGVLRPRGQRPRRLQAPGSHDPRPARGGARGREEGPSSRSNFSFSLRLGPDVVQLSKGENRETGHLPALS